MKPIRIWTSYNQIILVYIYQLVQLIWQLFFSGHVEVKLHLPPQQLLCMVFSGVLQIFRKIAMAHRHRRQAGISCPKYDKVPKSPLPRGRVLPNLICHNLDCPIQRYCQLADRGNMLDRCTNHSTLLYTMNHSGPIPASLILFLMK